MIDVTTSRIDVTAYAGGTPPHDIVPRKPGERWLVSHQPIRVDHPTEWMSHTSEAHVYIPVCPYLVVPEAELAMAYMLQLGLSVSLQLLYPVRRLHIVIGSPVHQVDRDGRQLWQVQYGFGIVLGG